MKKQNQLFIALLFVLVFTSTSAQNLPVFTDNVEDNTVAPINDYLPYALITAVALGCYFIRKIAHKKA